MPGTAKTRGCAGKRIAGLILLVALAGAIGLSRVSDGLVLRTLSVGALSSFYPNPASSALATGLGRVYIATAGGVSILDGASGAVLRRVALPVQPAAVALDERAMRLLVLGYRATSILDARTGAVLRAPFGGGIASGVMAVDARLGRVYVATNGGAEPTGSESMIAMASDVNLRNAVVGSTPMAVAVDDQTNRVYVANTSDDSVSVLDARTGAMLVTDLVARYPFDVAVDTLHGRVVIASGGVGACGATPCGSGLDVLDARSGAVIRIQRLNTSPMAVAVDGVTGRIFLLNSADNDYNVGVGISGISVLDERSGALVRVIALPPDPNLAVIAVDERRGRDYIAAQGASTATDAFMGSGRLYVLDARSGALLRAIGVVVARVAVAVDERSGHVFVLNAGGTERVADPWGWAPSWLRRVLPRPTATRVVPLSVSVLDITR